MQQNSIHHFSEAKITIHQKFLAKAIFISFTTCPKDHQIFFLKASANVNKWATQQALWHLFQFAMPTVSHTLATAIQQCK